MAFSHIRPSVTTLGVRHAMTYLSGHVDSIRVVTLRVLLDEMSQHVGLYKIDVNINNDKNYPHVNYLYKHLSSVRKHDTLAAVHSDRGVVDRRITATLLIIK